MSLSEGCKESIAVSSDNVNEINKNEEGEVIANVCSMWFIGLVFDKTNVNVDLTYDISSFTKAVHYQAENTNMLREGMTIEARHVRRKQLHQFLSPSLLIKRERTQSGTKRKHDAHPASTLNTHPPAPVKKTKRLSESSTDEVSILSYNDDSNSSNVVEVNIQNGNAANHSQETDRNKPTDKQMAKPEHSPSTSSTIASCYLHTLGGNGLLKYITNLRSAPSAGVTEDLVVSGGEVTSMSKVNGYRRRQIQNY
ncbi:jg8132 [Pararge aegeria aegeria]|uniref:Jg8132 protein n=1 Tax=Pararge aegeria aegeria TaxID=348720 RepID=A0A8S4RXS0_9NEOP|nr:jg8132 [Pararge aegeria aegeria]